MAHNGPQTRVTVYNQHQIFIADGSQWYIYDSDTSVLTGYTTDDAAATIAPSTVTFLDGYFVFSINGASNDRFYITNLFQGTTVGGLDWAAAEGDPDILQAVIADRRDLYLMGKKTLEVWYNAGDPDNRQYISALSGRLYADRLCGQMVSTEI
jgi:hypothetical protein